MIWNLCLWIALGIFVFVNIAVIIVNLKKTERNGNRILNSFLITTFISGFLLYIPVNHIVFRLDAGSVVKTLLVSLQNTLQMFSLDGDYGVFRDSVAITNIFWNNCYLVFAAVLYAIAPVLLLGVVVSLFKNIFSYFRLRIGIFQDIYVFSELNKRSLLLARSCLEKNREKQRRILLVFTDVFEERAEGSYESSQQAKELGAVCTKRDILTLNFGAKGKYRKIFFFVVGQNEAENVDHTLKLMEQYSEYENVSVYSFDTSIAGELAVESAMEKPMKMKVRRVNEVRTMIYTYLYENNLFRYALPSENDPEKKILNILLVGLGEYGTELLKALTWYGQMPGYEIRLHVYDKDASVEGKFRALCPELMKYNDCQTPGEAHYSIRFLGKGMEVFTDSFEKSVCDLGKVSMAFVALGDDNLNLQAAVKLRILFRRRYPDYEPVIRTVIYSSAKTDILTRYPLRTFDKARPEYHIDFIGDVRSMYSYDMVMHPEIEERGKEYHLFWANTEAEREAATRKYYQYEYYRRSSIARAIRSKTRKEMHIPGTEKERGSRSREELLRIQEAEHAGWNAYMRSEGYCYGEKRDDLAKIHPLLVPFEELPDAEKRKDDEL